MHEDRIDTGRSETEQAIMDATLNALAKHGYADLSIQNIGTEFDKSTSLLYYHYENKDELLLAFLDYVIDLYIATIDRHADDPDAEIRKFVGYLLPSDDEPCEGATEPEIDELEVFQRVIFELRTQTLHDEDYREKFGEMESYMIETVTMLIEREIDAGNYREMDAEMMAENLMAFLFRTLDMRVTQTRPESAEAMRKSVYFLLDHVMPIDGQPGDVATSDVDLDL
ncbi:DNA binding protein [Haloferax elongans ATCC BAA-1513]|uniref:DNA binding protein n=1 Tax=Haloferax elongans ATCC BAA-1513 TaxID=1230453 RepID=M0HH72_HALEO|nr:TetR/AcrR family transcriptional regulator [Haloferax elongans]ELZ83062.1 DNA binding protein [Haloferax elongans ATCC BAA-1513]